MRKGSLERQIDALMDARSVFHEDLAKEIGLTTDALFERLGEPGTLSADEIRKIERALRAPPGWRRMPRRDLPTDPVPLTRELSPEELEESDRLRSLALPAARRMLLVLRDLNRNDMAKRRGDIDEDEWRKRLGAMLPRIKEVETSMAFIARLGESKKRGAQS